MLTEHEGQMPMSTRFYTTTEYAHTDTHMHIH